MMGPGINRLIAVQHDYTMGHRGVFGWGRSTRFSARQPVRIRGRRQSPALVRLGGHNRPESRAGAGVCHFGDNADCKPRQ